jgi:hypothetical protein
LHIYVKVAEANEMAKELPRIQKQFQTFLEDQTRRMALAQGVKGDQSLLIWISDRDDILKAFFGFKESSQADLPEDAVLLSGDETVLDTIFRVPAGRS